MGKNIQILDSSILIPKQINSSIGRTNDICKKLSQSGKLKDESLNNYNEM
jgi:hypothetical protein